MTYIASGGVGEGMSAKDWDYSGGASASGGQRLSAREERGSGRSITITRKVAGDAVTSKTRSFLRWVGGKQHLITQLGMFLPHDVGRLTYIEPFAGAANLFFALQPKRAKLSDLNPHLMECYRYVKQKPVQVASYLREHKRNDSEQYYYLIREQYNATGPSAAQAARFIYLNRTCFNGVFRVNMAGAFNVPYGYKSHPIFPTAKELTIASRILARASLESIDYVEALGRVGKGVFAYVDPPYPPLNGTAYFTHYTANRFGKDDQERLADTLYAVNQRGGLFLMTNADLPLMRALYDRFNIVELSVKRSVSCKGSRKRVGELVITNYRPRGE